MFMRISADPCSLLPYHCTGENGAINLIRMSIDSRVWKRTETK